MFRPSPTRVPPRRGVILLIVIALLTLFAAVAIAFVYFANAKADAARAYREAQQINIATGPDIPADALFEEFLRQFIYDVNDDLSGVQSALRGHSLARTMYGCRPGAANDRAYCGTGRLHNAPLPPFLAGLAKSDPKAEEYNYVNYVYFQGDGYVHHPERVTWSAWPTPAGAMPGPGPYAGGFNPPYTFPDLNSMFLGAVKLPADQTDGTPPRVLAQSFHRDWTGITLDPANAGTNSIYDTTNPSLKYRTLRFRPAEMGPGFPTPTQSVPTNVPASECPFGDVDNLGLGYMDSVWLDLGYPKQTLPDGRLYKPLFAAFVLDLDGRVNVNSHGNIRGAGQAHRSNQGFGPWEVSLAPVLDLGGTEWTRLFTGAADAKGQFVPGRYGSPAPPAAAPYFIQPTPNPNVPAPGLGATPHFYAAVDFDACDATGQVSGPVGKPTGASSFPGYPGGYDSGSAAELDHHPAVYNILHPGYAYDSTTGRMSYDRVFDGPAGWDPTVAPFHPDFPAPPATAGPWANPPPPYPATNLGKLLYAPVDDIANTELGRLLPTNLNPVRPPKPPPPDPQPLANAALKRWLLTTLSSDVDQPGIVPWAWPDAAAGAYEMPPGPGISDPANAATWGPKGTGPGGAIPFPGPAAVPGAGGEFSTGDGRAVEPLLNLGRLDLNRPLASYYDPATGAFSATLAATATAERQTFAGDLFARLVYVTTGADTTTALAAAPAGSKRHDALRWLAQLAVNIVDFIDADDYMTPFNWDANDDTTAGAWVLGTELPRLVLNEVYCQLANDPDNAAGPFLFNFWVELFNPFVDAGGDTTLYDPDGAPGSARLTVDQGGTPVAAYQLMISDATTKVRQNDNVLGDPDATPTRLLVDDFGPAGAPTAVVPPPASGGGTAGYYVLGPATASGTAIPFPATGMTPTYSPPSKTVMGQQRGLSYLSTATNAGYLAASNLQTLKHTVMLRRLACPYLPPNTTPGPGFNPYVTVDYVEGLTPNDDVTSTASGPHSAPLFSYPHRSKGKAQPYASHAAQLKDQTTLAGLLPPNLNYAHTFFKVNTPRTDPFQWLVHLDRPLISPMELLHVSAFKPGELTQQFMAPAQSFGHTAPWFDNARRIFRLFEFVTTAHRGAGLAGNYAGNQSAGGRVPGKININTVWEKSTFLALCDAQASNANSFDAGALATIWDNLSTSRGTPGEAARPFKGLAVGFDTGGSGTQYPAGSGVEDTILRPAPSAPTPAPPSAARLLENPTLGSNPFDRYGLLSKVYNNITTRSNVFAVWLTVGFFQVTDDTVLPLKLGAEIGSEEGQTEGTPVHRHHLFAVIDRSALVRPGPVLGNLTVPVAKGYNNLPLLPGLRAGSLVILDTGVDAETVPVLGVHPATGQFSVYCNREHAAGVPVKLGRPGNPGPQASFKPLLNPALVPYYTVRD